MEIHSVNSVQIVPQTWEERFKMYMKLTKKELASMLAESAKYTYPEACAECCSKKEAESTITSTSTTYWNGE